MNQLRFFLANPSLYVRSLAILIAVATFTLASLAALGHRGDGTSPSGAASLESGSITVDDESVALGEVGPGSVIQATYLIKNTGTGPVRLLGAKPSCSCTVVDGLPVALGPSQEHLIHLRITAPRTPSRFSGSASLFTDDPLRREIDLIYKGTSVAGEG